MQTECRKQNPTDAIQPFRHLLIFTPHPRQCKQRGDQRKPAKGLQQNQSVDPAPLESGDIIPDEQGKILPK